MSVARSSASQPTGCPAQFGSSNGSAIGASAGKPCCSGERDRGGRQADPRASGQKTCHRRGQNRCDEWGSEDVGSPAQRPGSRSTNAHDRHSTLTAHRASRTSRARVRIAWNPVADTSDRASSDSGSTGRITKHIFVTGGVVSSLGKGLTAASLGNLLTARGLRVVMQKLDPYLNVDPGTMNPFQHGEVFVTDDGAETDLDIGHYERFLDINLNQAANVTTGQIYSQVIARERRGEYLGDTVQVIPHITDEIKRRMRLQAEDDVQPDVIITEIGGTVGDIESQPFIEAARQVRHELSRRNVFFVHVSLVPFMGASGEQKTKPTQHSVAALRSIGIQPRRPRAAQRSPGVERESPQDRPHVRRRRGRRGQCGGCFLDLRHPLDAAQPGPRQLHHGPARLARRRGAVGPLERLAHGRARAQA